MQVFNCSSCPHLSWSRAAHTRLHPGRPPGGGATRAGAGTPADAQPRVGLVRALAKHAARLCLRKVCGRLPKTCGHMFAKHVERHAGETCRPTAQLSRAALPDDLREDRGTGWYWCSRTPRAGACQTYWPVGGSSACVPDHLREEAGARCRAPVLSSRHASLRPGDGDSLGRKARRCPIARSLRSCGRLGLETRRPDFRLFKGSIVIDFREWGRILNEC